MMMQLGLLEFYLISAQYQHAMKCLYELNANTYMIEDSIREIWDSLHNYPN